MRRMAQVQRLQLGRLFIYPNGRAEAESSFIHFNSKQKGTLLYLGDLAWRSYAPHKRELQFVAAGKSASDLADAYAQPDAGCTVQSPTLIARRADYS